MTDTCQPDAELDKKIEAARAVDLFRDLDEGQIEAVARIMAPVSLRANHVVMREGETGHSVYVLVEGEVQVNKALTMKFGQDDFRETEKTLIVLSSRNSPVFGEMALVSDSERSASVTTITDCTLYKIKREDFLNLAEKDQALGFKVTLRIAALLSDRLKKSSDDVIRLTTALSIALSH